MSARRTFTLEFKREAPSAWPEKVTGRVKRWRDGDMRQRWCTSGLLDAEGRFNRVKGYKHLDRLITTVEQDVNGLRLDNPRKRA